MFPTSSYSFISSLTQSQRAPSPRPSLSHWPSILTRTAPIKYVCVCVTGLRVNFATEAERVLLCPWRLASCLGRLAAHSGDQHLKCTATSLSTIWYFRILSRCLLSGRLLKVWMFTSGLLFWDLLLIPVGKNHEYNTDNNIYHIYLK